MEGMKQRIARRVAQELRDGDVVNLGIGLPTMVADYVPEGVEIILQSENGILGMGGSPTPQTLDLNIQNAGAQFITVRPGAMFFDSAYSFGLIRGGHIDVTVLGAFEVDQEGNLANWMIPGGKIAGMGGAMDLSTGARRVIVATLHTGKTGPKLVKACNYPLTARHAVDTIVTEMGVFRWEEGTGFVLTEHFDDFTVEQIRRNTQLSFAVSEQLKSIKVVNDYMESLS